jgi:cell division protein FtsW
VLVAGIMMFAGGTRLRWFAIVIVVVAVVGVITVTKLDYAADRITAWQHPESDPSNNGYQVLQSLYAIGSGGLMGLGIGQGRQKYLYLPEEHNDYIFSVVCEELGYIGAILILLLFALLIVRGFWLALHARDRFSSLVVTGLTSLLAIQVFLNVGVVTNLLPSTGISLPFFSYGGTALWIQLVEMGIILSASRDIPIVKAG